MTPPLVSIITPVYNGEKYLEETLLSVFAQTYKNWELIVVDDGSTTDACAKICRKYADKMKYIRQENRGLSASRNRGIQEARGEYVAFIDQDDLWSQEKLEKQIARYEEFKSNGIEAGLIYTRLVFIDSSGNVKSYSPYNRSGNLLVDLIYSDMVGTPSSVMIDRDVLNAVGGGFDETIRSYSDVELWIRIAERYSIYCLDEFLTKYRITPGQLSEDVALFAPDVEALAQRIITLHPEIFSHDQKKMEAFLQHHRRYIAQAWKDSAYRKLFRDSDGASYRQDILNGYAKHASTMGPKVWAYFILSVFSVRLCQAIKRLKQK